MPSTCQIPDTTSTSTIRQDATRSGTWVEEEFNLTLSLSTTFQPTRTMYSTGTTPQELLHGSRTTSQSSNSLASLTPVLSFMPNNKGLPHSRHSLRASGESSITMPQVTYISTLPTQERKWTKLSSPTQLNPLSRIAIFISVELHSTYRFAITRMLLSTKALVDVQQDASTSQHSLPQMTLSPPLQSMADSTFIVKLVTL